MALKLLLVCMEHNYGDPARGRSYEYYSFFETLQQLGVDIRLYDFASELKARGKDPMNAHLLETARDWCPDVVMFSLYTDEILEKTVKAMRGMAKTLCFFHDDTWRVDWSMKWAGIFDWFTTPDVYGSARYTQAGLTNFIPFPFGCNEKTYRKLEGSRFKYDVSFVGAWHPYREWIIKRLRKAGIEAHGFGFGWPSGPVSQNEMIRIFNETKVNLNLSNSASWDIRYLLSSPRALINRLRSPKTIEQLKARIFELNCCGSFQLSYYVEGLERYFAIGDEIGIYLDSDDLVRKAKLYLEDAGRRDRIASAGQARALRDHTFRARFRAAFEKMGVVSGL